MPLSSEPLRKLGFLTIGLFEEADPRRGHESTLEIIELGEQLGFDSVWVRQRHLQFGISSPVAILAAEPASDFSGVEGFELFSDRVQPYAPGLGRRMWYGGASLRSGQWAGEHQMNFLTSSVVKAEESTDFAEIQLSHIRRSVLIIPTVTGLAFLRDSSSSLPIPHRRSSAASTRNSPAGGRCAPPRRRVLRACCSRLISSDLRADRRTTLVSRGLPASRRGGVRPSLHLRPPGLCADPHRYRHEARPGSWLGAS